VDLVFKTLSQLQTLNMTTECVELMRTQWLPAIEELPLPPNQPKSVFLEQYQVRQASQTFEKQVLLTNTPPPL